MPDEPVGSISQQDNAGHNTAVKNASLTTTPSDNRDSPVNSNDNGDNYSANVDLQSKGNNLRHRDDLPSACLSGVQC